ncbi:MAG: sigma-70 family RNA polymerase sigma factor [Eubacterium sp.]|nr:sigma-70 family RNA polymerase sigma factor [Eubacterium sp.]
MDDSEIIELFYARSEQAIAELSDKYGHICIKTAENILKNHPDAEECVNDAYLGVWNTVPPQRPKPLLTYLCRIVRNIAINKYHSNTAKKRNSYYDAALSELYDTVTDGRTAEDELETNELSRVIDAFLATLNKESRVMFVRRYWHSDSVKDIAARMGISPHAATIRLSRIRTKFKNYLDEHGEKI